MGGCARAGWMMAFHAAWKMATPQA